MKKLTVREFAIVKRVAQNVNSLVEKKNKHLNKIQELQEEIESLEKQIAAHEVGVKAIADGYTSEDLVEKTFENKFNSKGEEIKVTKYGPSSIVEYSNEDRCYYIKEEEVKLESPESVEEIDDSKLNETEEKPSDEGSFDPTKLFSEEDKDTIPYME